MAGCFGGGMFDRHFENQLNKHLDASEHHPRCDFAEEGDEFLEDGITPYEKVCTCHELNEDDKVSAKMNALGL